MCVTFSIEILVSDLRLDVWAAGDFHLAIFASKLIKRGDELFLSYGHNFWTSPQNVPVIPRESK